ncbi:2Fe-2S iron-sulfur cluster binding domain-containing protein [Marinomonas epiphytica]
MSSNEEVFCVEIDDRLFSIHADDILLDALLSQSEPISHGCRAGACGACRLFDIDTQQWLYACQTKVERSYCLTYKSPAPAQKFALQSQSQLDSSHCLLTLFGPSDDGFGDKLIIKLEDHDIEVMAVNPPGETLQVVVSLEGVPPPLQSAYAAGLASQELYISSTFGKRKGRLLHEWGLDDKAVVLLLASDNRIFDGYWHEALQSQNCSTVFVHTLVSDADFSAQADLSEKLSEFIARNTITDLCVLYHGRDHTYQALTSWLRSQRIRASQLHFIS